MVQEKDEAKKRHQRRMEYALKARQEYENSIRATKWAVVEHTPEVPYDGGWDRGTPAKDVIVSNWFDTREEAVEWRERHEPDPGNSLRIAYKHLTEKLVRQWSGVFTELERK